MAQQVIPDARYAPWLQIADELEDLHKFAYGVGGFLVKISDLPYQPTPLHAASWIRKKCGTGGWYWWDKTKLKGKAEWPLRSFGRMVSEANWDTTPQGREFVSKFESLQGRIDKVAKGEKLGDY